MRLLLVALFSILLAAPAAAQDWIIYPGNGTGDGAVLESENVPLGITIGCGVERQRFSFGLWLDSSRHIGPQGNATIWPYILRFDDHDPFGLVLGFTTTLGEKAVLTYDDEDTKPLLLHLLTSNHLSVNWEPVDDLSEVNWERAAHFNLDIPSTKNAVGGVLSSCGMLPTPTAAHQLGKYEAAAKRQAAVARKPEPMRVLFADPRGVNELSQRPECRGFQATTNEQRAQFSFAIQEGGGFWSGGYEITVFNTEADIIYTGRTELLTNAVKDACLAVRGALEKAR